MNFLITVIFQNNRRSIKTYFNLKHNHRIGEGSTRTQTLNQFKIGEQNNEVIATLKSRCITKLSKSYPYGALHMFFQIEK